jgi:hypothetical protein
MSINNDDLLLGLCSAVGARALTCGYNPEQLSYDYRQLQYLTELTLTTALPPNWLLKALHFRVKKLGITNDNDCQQLVLSDALRRYRQGVGVSRLKLEQLKNKHSEMATNLEEELPTGLMSKSCEVDQNILHKLLSPLQQSTWPKGTDGKYKLDTTTLLEMDTPLSSLILEAKGNHKINIVNYLNVDEDARHRSWANPYGTKTGRERPKGGSFVFWSKAVQAIIKAPEGYVVAKLDFDQQEPAILAALSGSERLIEAYLKGDLYEFIYSNGLWGGLSRKQFKTLIIAYLYGIQDIGISKKWNVELDKAKEWRLELDLVFMQAQQWMNASSRKAYCQGFINSMDWRMRITNSTNPLTVKNWPIQASGADILRRSCLKLANHQINVIGCLHDAVMIEIPILNHAQTINTAQKLMADASADVLSGFRLKTSIEAIYR